MDDDFVHFCVPAVDSVDWQWANTHLGEQSESVDRRAEGLVADHFDTEDLVILGRRLEFLDLASLREESATEIVESPVPASYGRADLPPGECDQPIGLSRECEPAILGSNGDEHFCRDMNHGESALRQRGHEPSIRRHPDCRPAELGSGQPARLRPSGFEIDDGHGFAAAIAIDPDSIVQDREIVPRKRLREDLSAGFPVLDADQPLAASARQGDDQPVSANRPVTERPRFRL